jgi:hypothetical protein
MFSTLVRLGLLAGFLVAARRILSPDPRPAPLLEPPRKSAARQRTRKSRART